MDRLIYVRMEDAKQVTRVRLELETHAGDNHVRQKTMKSCEDSATKSRVFCLMFIRSWSRQKGGLQ